MCLRAFNCIWICLCLQVTYLCEEECHGLSLVPLPLSFCSSVFCCFCTFPVLFCRLILDSPLPALVFSSGLITCTCPSLVHSPVPCSQSASLYISVPFLCSLSDCCICLYQFACSSLCISLPVWHPCVLPVVPVDSVLYVPDRACPAYLPACKPFAINSSLLETW